MSYFLKLLLLHHVQSDTCHHGMTRSVRTVGVDGVKIRRLAANI